MYFGYTNHLEYLKNKHLSYPRLIVFNLLISVINKNITRIIDYYSEYRLNLLHFVGIAVIVDNNDT